MRQNAHMDGNDFAHNQVLMTPLEVNSGLNEKLELKKPLRWGVKYLQEQQEFKLTSTKAFKSMVENGCNQSEKS